MKPYRIITLGCKVNQCESAAIGHLLENAGWDRGLPGDAPDVIVINTCAVTGRAAMQSRQAIRRSLREHPGARIVVTGCYAQVSAEEIRAIGDVDLIAGNDRKMRLVDILCNAELSEALRTQPPAEPSCAFTALPAVDSRERTRAFLKIQDGCNTRCTYCIVPYARGASRSMPMDDVRAHLLRLAADGFRETVLTGIHLGAYGSDLQPPTSLGHLLAVLTAHPPMDRIRLSSIEPTEIDARIIEMAAQPSGVLCRHFHIPLQSGDDEVLRRMGRPYRREAFAAVVEDIHRIIPDAAIGVDVMAGFPGETDEAFRNTCRLIEELPITYLHVFPFSPRKGTPAAAFKNQVPQKVSKERCRILRELGGQKRTAFYRRMTGKRLSVLTETTGDETTGPAGGWSDNYVPVTIANARVDENTITEVVIEGVGDDGTVIGKTV